MGLSAQGDVVMPEPDELIFDDGLSTLPDRRRPGRVSDVSPELIPLLRQPASLGMEAAQLGEHIPLLADCVLRSAGEHAGTADDLRSARGVLIGFAISLSFWLACFAAMGFMAG
jgi:hypothetical protein